MRFLHIVRVRTKIRRFALDKVRKLQNLDRLRESPLVGQTETALQNGVDGLRIGFAAASPSSPDRRTTPPVSVSLFTSSTLSGLAAITCIDGRFDRALIGDLLQAARLDDLRADRRLSFHTMSSTSLAILPEIWLSAIICTISAFAFARDRTGRDGEARLVQTAEILVDQPVGRSLGFRACRQHARRNSPRSPSRRRERRRRRRTDPAR